MPDPVLTEEPLQFGEGGRLLAVLTLPAGARPAHELPVFVLLNAGSLHRVGPARLHVRVARELARLGLATLRVDLAGTGDSPARAGLTNQESVAADFREIAAVLDSRLGRAPLVVGGLCSGADNSIRLAARDPRVVGMVLLDPFCYPDDGFKARAAMQKYLDPVRYIEAAKRRIRAWTTPPAPAVPGLSAAVDYWAIRDLPTPEQLEAGFTAIGQRNGRVLSIFTRYALPYYNQLGQLERVLGVDGYADYCTERFWPWAEHTFPIELHRQRLIDEIANWAKGYLRPVISTPLLAVMAAAGGDEVRYAS